MPAPEIRLPLQVGTSAYFGVTRAASIVVPSLAIVFGIGEIILRITGDGALVFTIACMAGTYLLVFAFVLVRVVVQAVRERPSDVVFGPDGFRIVGGPHHGRTFDRSKAAPTVTRTKRTRLFDLRDQDEIEVATLSVGDDVLAVSARPIETSSLEALARTIRALAAGNDAAGNDGAPPPSPDVLRCAACGAPVAPRDGDSVTCPFCHAKVAVPDAIRGRVHDKLELDAVSRRNEERLRSVLRQPSARIASAAMLAVGVPMALVWPLVGSLALMLQRSGSLGLAAVVVLALAGATLLAAGFFLMRVFLVDRQALALVALRFGARPPSRPGAPATCRMCSAPLPDAPGRVVVKCIYCDAENVLGLDLHRDVERASEESASLSNELSRRARDRLRFGLLAVVAAACVAGDGRLLSPFVHTTAQYVASVRRARHDCDAGDADACLGLASLHGIDRGEVRAANDRARVLLSASCAKGDARACSTLVETWDLTNQYRVTDLDALPTLEAGCAHAVAVACDAAAKYHRPLAGEDNHGIADAASRAATLYRKACDLGDGEGCYELGVMYYDGQGVAKDKDASTAFLEKACDRNSASGCSLLSPRVWPDTARQRALEEKACKLGDANACKLLSAERR